VEKVKENIEPIIKAQLNTLKAQIDILREYIENNEESNVRLKYIIANELVEALIKRFEKNETKIDDLKEKIESIDMSLKEKVEELHRITKMELSEEALSKAVSKILDTKDIEVDSRPLLDLKDI
jgi:CII-binding regulator of phage lambda lysogenization HflD